MISRSPLKHTLFTATGLFMLIASAQPAFAQSSGRGNAASPHRAFLDRYCVACHNEALKTANLVLDKADVADISGNPQLWEKVVTKLSLRAMPPVGMPLRPGEDEYRDMLSYLVGELDRLAAQDPNPGRTTVHRLNRTEYANAIRDLLALEIDGESLLPPDNVDQGFDNIAEVLAVSPLLMEQYVLAAGKISRQAVGPSTMLPASHTYTVSDEFIQDAHMSKDLPFGSRGGMAVKHYFPMDGEYTLRIKLARNGEGYIRGMRREHLLDVRLDRGHLKKFRVGGEVHGKSGPLFTHSNNPDFAGDTDQIGYEFSADKDLELSFTVKAGQHLVGVTFMDARAKPTGFLTPDLMLKDTANYKGGNPAIDSVVITGPYNVKGPGETPSRERIFVCRPGSPAGQETCAGDILENLAHLAYRRPVSGAELDSLLAMYRQGEQEGGFERGVELALQRILAGPEFLFRIEKDPGGAAPGTVYPVSQLDLASRLSFFLWSSIPDLELLALAEQGRLGEPGVLEKQVRRMLDDPRSGAMIDNFGEQWLAIREMDFAAPQKAVFPAFDGALRVAMKQELKLWFESMIREDHSVREMLTSDYTYLNQRLAEHYGVPGVYGDNFRRVNLDRPERRGLLGKAGVLTVTSYNSRTSPVVRGKWVLENMLDMAPPPPPADAFEPELKVESDEGRALTMKEAMEAHRQNPVCANCHKMMEPIGLALENFDGIGSFRTRYLDAGVPVDSSGILFDSSEFADTAGFRQEFLKHSERFVHTVTTKLLTYALGRKLEYYDQPVIREILNKSKADDYTWSSLILGVIESTPFQYRRVQQ